ARPAAPAPAPRMPVVRAPVPPPPPPPAAPAPKPARDLSVAAAFVRAGLSGTMRSDLVAAAQYDDVTRTKASLPSASEAAAGSRGDRRLGGRVGRNLLSLLPKDRVSLDFDNTDIRGVLKLMAAKAHVNIIYGPDVQGNLTLHLRRTPFDEAFRSVLSMMNLTTDQIGDSVLRVITPAALNAQRTTGSPITQVIPLNYAKAADVKTTIDAVRTAEGRAGSTSVDAKTNSIIVTESLEGLEATENLIAQLDQRPKQVLIEAKLIEVNANSGFDYGIQWNSLGLENGSIGGKSGTNVIGGPAGQANTTLTPGALNGNALYGTSGGSPYGAAGPGTGVNLAADKIFGALTLGRITNNYILNATITAAASEGKAKVLSDPKITTLNNQPANINVTTQIPYVTSNVASTGVQTQTVTYATTGIQLTVTPSINADGRILLQVNPNVSQPSVTASGSTQTGAPAIDSRNASTTVLVRDGETIVIGGLISDSLQDTISKVPLLGDIPILGWLFKKKTKTRTRNELLIFVTTKILPD
ncbi:MAG: type IV pilus secretin PilQ, partial [Elusimicrobia bacterium]|nr:type IV pilus secretin PilQ [Elusimicrobiota bacterium]